MSKNQSAKKRYFEYGFSTGYLPSGKTNSIADVSGVTIGHISKIEGTDVRTGVTVIDPGVNNLFQEKIPAAFYVANGAGKVAGVTQVEEYGTIEAPIALTNTHAVGSVMRGIIDLVIKQNPDLKPTDSINAVVGEVNDGYLSNIHKNVIEPEDVNRAYAARSGDVAIGSVGAGTGTRCFYWKGGIGTSSRIVSLDGQKYTIGVLVQTNFGGSLNLAGIPFGKLVGKSDFTFEEIIPDGSCVIVVATNAPFTARQLKRLAKRAIIGLTNTGSVVATYSGDYVISFSTNRDGIEGVTPRQKLIPDTSLNNFFLATVEATEESIFDALFAAETMRGKDGNVRNAFPIEESLKYL
jgi:D-aminopeptidase